MTSPRDLVRGEILALTAYHVPPATGLVKLDAMENPYRLPPEVARELGARLADVAINRYPDPSASALKARLRSAMGIPESLGLVLGNGSDELIQMLSLLVAKPGAVALAVEPSFVMYRMSAVISGLRYEGVPLGNGFALDEAAVMAAFTRHRPALTWLAYPNNPTGTLFPREAILRLAAAAPGLLVVDEAYYPFAGGATLLDAVGRVPNLLVVRTVSKLGLAGLRLGLCVGPREWTGELEKLRPPYNVNVLTAAAADWVLAQGDLLAAQAAAIVAERAVLEHGLDALGLVHFPSAANFVLVRVPDAPAAFEGLKARGILVKNLHGSHPQLAHCLRLTVGTPDENRKLLAALAATLGPSHAQG